MTQPSSYLVVGGSGILAPAVTQLVAAGHRVTAMSRSRQAPAGASWLRCDGHSLTAFSAAASDTRWAHAIVYVPAVSADTLALIRDHVDGTVVVLRTSKAAAPENTRDHNDDELILGWVELPHGTSRWHTPAEVSAAALRVARGEPLSVLGSVRPWEGRPA